MKYSIFSAVIVVILLSGHSISQVSQEWVSVYNGNYSQGNRYDGATGLAVDGSGNSYVTGYSLMNGGFYNYVTLKYNTAGVMQWMAIYDWGTEDFASSIDIDGSGNVYVTGRSGNSTSVFDIATVKYNNSGVQQWEQRYDGQAGGDDRPFSLRTDNSGNVYVTGESVGNGTGYDYVTIKYNTAGVQQWAQTYNGPANAEDAASSIAVDAFGNVYVTGRSAAGGSCFDYATIKYNSAGVQQWVQRYNGEANSCDLAKSVALDASGNIYVTGQSGGNGTGYDYVTIKYNSSGAQQWVQRYNSSGSNDDISNSIAIDGTGNAFVTGTGYTTIKYNSSGVQQWIKTYGTLTANSITADASGNCYVTGQGFITVKYNPSGLQQWIQIYSGYDSYSAVAIAKDNSDNIYTAGTGWTSSTNPDYYTIKYSQMVGIKPISSEIPNQYQLYQNYPNPFNPATKIRFSLPSPSPAIGGINSGGAQEIKLVVYDVLGREAAMLVNEQLQPGTYEVEWDALNYPSGVYYYRLVSNKFTETKEMVLIK